MIPRPPFPFHSPSASAGHSKAVIAELARKCSAAGQERYALETLVRPRLRQAFGENSNNPLNQKAETWWELAVNPLGDAERAAF